jgi:hypothetical protein
LWFHHKNYKRKGSISFLKGQFDTETKRQFTVQNFGRQHHKHMVLGNGNVSPLPPKVQDEAAAAIVNFWKSRYVQKWKQQRLIIRAKPTTAPTPRKVAEKRKDRNNNIISPNDDIITSPNARRPHNRPSISATPVAAVSEEPSDIETETPCKPISSKRLFITTPAEFKTPSKHPTDVNTPSKCPTLSPTTPHMISELTASLNHLNVTPLVRRSNSYLSPTKASRARDAALLHAGKKNPGVGNALIRAGKMLEYDTEEKKLKTGGTIRARRAADGQLQKICQIKNVIVGIPPRELEASKCHQLWGPAASVPVVY